MKAAIEARVQELLADPGQAASRLGTSASARDGMLHLLERAGAASSHLRQVNEQLLPLVGALKVPGKVGRWWRWFTGVELENEMTFPAASRQIETFARDGLADSGGLAGLLDHLTTEDRLLKAELEAMEIDLQAARFLLGKAPAGAAFQESAGAEGVERLARKLANLEALLTALQLTRAQYRVAAQHAKEMLERFEDIKTLLVPLWYQRMGFELFSQRVKPD